MHVLIVYAHPEPSSFCAALRDVAVAAIRAAGHEATISDLHAEGFNPVPGRHDFTTIADAGRFHYQTEQLHAAQNGGFAPDIAREQARVKAADAIIFVYPLWWGGPPAMLKGWVDRVLAYGFAYVDGARFATGLFRHKRSLLCVTTGGTEERFSAEGVYGTIDQVLWSVQHLTFDYMGLVSDPPFIAYGTPRVGPEGRAAYLAAFRARVEALLAKGIIPADPTEAAPTIADPAPWARKA